MANPNPPDWEMLAQKPGFKALLDAKKRFVVPCCIFFLLYYFALLYLVGWHPELMKKPAFAGVNTAVVYGFSLIVAAKRTGSCPT